MDTGEGSIELKGEGSIELKGEGSIEMKDFEESHSQSNDQSPSRRYQRKIVDMFSGDSLSGGARSSNEYVGMLSYGSGSEYTDHGNSNKYTDTDNHGHDDHNIEDYDYESIFPPGKMSSKQRTAWNSSEEYEEDSGDGQYDVGFMGIDWRKQHEIDDGNAHLPNFSHGQLNFAVFIHVLFFMYVGLILVLKHLQYPNSEKVQYCIISALLFILLISQFLLMNVNLSRYPQFKTLRNVLNIILTIFAIFCIIHLESLTYRGPFSICSHLFCVRIRFGLIIYNSSRMFFIVCMFD